MKSLSLHELKELEKSAAKIRATEGKTDIVHFRFHIRREIERKEFLAQTGKNFAQV